MSSTLVKNSYLVRNWCYNTVYCAATQNESSSLFDTIQLCKFNDKLCLLLNVSYARNETCLQSVKVTDNIPNNQVISKCDCNSKHKTPTECDFSDDCIMMKNIDVPATMNKKLIQIFGCFYICITGKIVLWSFQFLPLFNAKILCNLSTWTLNQFLRLVLNWISRRRFLHWENVYRRILSSYQIYRMISLKCSLDVLVI